jgi:hypothetical protein
MNNQEWKQLGWRKRIGRLILLTCAIVSLVIGFLIPPQQPGSIPWEYVIIGVGLIIWLILEQPEIGKKPSKPQ